jgi:hypothetical protein
VTLVADLLEYEVCFIDSLWNFLYPLTGMRVEGDRTEIGRRVEEGAGRVVGV